MKGNGYMALTSVILISVTLLFTLSAVSYDAYFANLDFWRSEDRRESRYLAESCLAILKLRLALNPDYSPIDVAISLDSGSCVIESLQKVKGIFGRSSVELPVNI